VVFYAATQMERKEGARVLLAVGGLLLAFFGVRYVRGGKFMPAGVMSGLRYGD
jgi:uncharacterized membrane protein (UPF0136 family)